MTQFCCMILCSQHSKMNMHANLSPLASCQVQCFYLSRECNMGVADDDDGVVAGLLLADGGHDGESR